MSRPFSPTSAPKTASAAPRTYYSAGGTYTDWYFPDQGYDSLQWTFQPVQDAGRNEGFDGKANRFLLTQIRREVAKADVFGIEDMIPLPCNPDQICIGYGLRNLADLPEGLREIFRVLRVGGRAEISRSMPRAA